MEHKHLQSFYEYEKWFRSLLENTNPSTPGAVTKATDKLLENNIKTFEAMLKNLAERDVEYICAVCYLIYYKPVKGAVPVLRSLLSHESDEVRMSSMVALGEFNTRKVIKDLLKIAESDNSLELRCRALNLIAFMFNKTASPRLRRLLGNEEVPPEVRGDAAEALANIGDRKAIPLLIKVSYDRSPIVRFWACYALGQMPDRRSLPRLEQIAEYDDGEIEHFGSVKAEAKDAMIYILRHYMKKR